MSPVGVSHLLHLNEQSSDCCGHSSYQQFDLKSRASHFAHTLYHANELDEELDHIGVERRLLFHRVALAHHNLEGVESHRVMHEAAVDEQAAAADGASRAAADDGSIVLDPAPAHAHATVALAAAADAATGRRRHFSSMSHLGTESATASVPPFELAVLLVYALHRMKKSWVHAAAGGGDGVDLQSGKWMDRAIGFHDLHHLEAQMDHVEEQRALVTCTLVVHLSLLSTKMPRE